MSFRNRCTLNGANGPVHLSVPLVGGRGQRTLMKDVRVDRSEQWQSRHWKTIMSCYNRSPWFDFFRHSLETLFTRKVDFLLDWDMACLDWLCDTMSLNLSIRVSEQYIPGYNREAVRDLRNRWLPASINRLNAGDARYPQVFEERHGFVPNLSVLDRIFCAGKFSLSTNG